MKLSILRAAAEAPGRTALVHRGETLSFADLAAEVRAAIGWLRRRGVDPLTPKGAKQRAALPGDSTREALVLVYALAELGVPMVLLHPRSTAAERRRTLAATGTGIFLDPADLRLRPEVDPEPFEPLAIDPERPLAIVRTSGTAGPPKGVVLSRRAFAAAAQASAENLGWRGDDRWLLSLPVAHVGGLSILTRCLIARRTAVAEPLPRFAAAAAARLVERRRITLLSLVPTMLRRLLDLDGWRPPAHLRAILVGGAAVPPALLERAGRRGWPVLLTYGLTEACSQVATQRYGTAPRSGRGAEPLPGVEVRIRGGVIELRGPSLLSGYLPPPAEPVVTDDGWLCTGDLGELDAEGRLHVLGRADEVIVTGGENVHPREVERALLEHPAITAACVFGVDDDEWGQAVAAALVADPPPGDRELLSFLAERLAPHRRPRWVAFLDALPATASGKEDRRLAARRAAPHLRPLDRPSRPGL